MTAYQNSQSGFSIVEMMIAMGLSVVLLMGVLQIFDANRVSSRLQHAFAEVQETGRIAAELLARDIRMADYWGCAPDISSISDHLDDTDTAFYKDYMKIIGQDGITGEDNVTGKTFGAIEVKDGTDVLTMKGASNLEGAKVTPPYMQQNAARIHLKDGIVIPKGTVLMISDCTGGDLFSNSMDTQANTGRLGHNTGNNGSGVNNKTKDLSRVYNGNAQITIPYQRSYFIGKNPDAGWSLYWEDNGTVEELVRNVDDLQFVYGEDTTGNGSADTFGDATAVNMDNVVSVRATFNTFSSDNVFDGAALNRMYNITANIRNRTL